MKKTTLSILLIVIGFVCQAQTVFINEIHYDNSGGDVNESVEIAGPAGTDLSTFSIVLYNGSNGTQYNTVALTGSIDDEGSGFGAIAQPISGIQNGAPDGIALLDGGAVIQFLSYEGSLTATNGPANGMTSTDIGVNETSGTPVGESLQLTGTGTLYTDFVWNAPAAESPGDINTGQTFSGGGAGSPPVIACPLDATANVVSGTCGAVVVFADAIATDPDGDLDTVTQTAGLPSGSTFPVGTTTIQFTATDLEGNTASCTFTITVIDDEAPVAVCQDITVELDASGNYVLNASELDGGSTDNCGVASVEIGANMGPGSLYGLETLTGGNDNIYRFEYDPSTDAIALIDNPYSPATSGNNYSIDMNPTNGAVYLLGTGTSGNRTLFEYDLDNATIGVEIGDVISANGASNPNAMVFGADGTLYISFGNGDLDTYDIGTQTATTFITGLPTGGNGLTYDYDNDVIIQTSGTGPIQLTSVDTGGTVTPLFSFNTTCADSMQAAEYVGNGKLLGSGTFGCDAIFTVDLNTQVVTDILTPTGGATNYKSFLFTPGMISGETSVTLTCADIGVNSLTVLVTDDSGNQTTCTAEVTVEDNTAPEIVCVGETTTGTAVFINEIHYDNGGADQDEAIEIAGPAGTDLSTYTITLYNGNGGTEYNSVPLSGTIGDEGAGFGAINFPISGIQNGAPDGVVLSESGTVIQFLSYEGSFTAVDGIASGLSSTDIGVSESSATAIGESMQLTGTGMFYENYTWTAPLASTPGAINTGQTFVVPNTTPLEVVLDANGMASINASDLIVSVTEVCGFTVTGGVPSSSDIIVNGSFETGDFTGWTAVDNPGPFLPWAVTGDNSGNGFFDPALPTDGALLAGNGFDGGIGEAVLYQDVTLPAGLNATLTWDENLDYNLLDFCNGCSDRIYEVQVRDLSDNVLEVLTGVTATAGVLENDNAWISQTADLTAYAGQDIRIAYWQNIPDENSGPAKFALDNVSLVVDGTAQVTTIDLDCSNIGENLIEVTVTDDSGNSASCFASVTVLDETAPILVCADTTIELGEDGTAVVDPEALLATLPSSYEVITISSDNQSGTPGNTDFTVDVTADETVSFDWSYSTDDGPGFDGFGYLVNGVYTEVTDPAGANNQTGSTTVALLAGDVFGFRSSSVDGGFGAATTVISNFMPGFEGQFDPANWTLDLDNSDGDAFFVEIPGGPLSFDACGITVLAVDVTEVTCADIGTPITVTVFASDASGNIAACTAVVTVVDLLGPVITCPADQTVDPGEGNLFYEVPDYFATGEATVTDNCTDPVTITSQDPAPGELISDGVYTVTLTAEDEYGNIGECTFELTVESVLGLDDNKLDSAISMYPNPAHSNVTISNSSNISLEKAAIYDTNGRLIQTINLRDMQQEKTFDVSALATGVYMVQIQSENATATKRLVKE